jgi:RecA-family ATPase
MKITPKNQIAKETEGQKREFILRGITAGSISVLAGTGGSGKGFFILNMLDDKNNILNNDEYHKLTPKRIAFLNFEDDILTIKTRLGDAAYHDWDFVDCIGLGIFDEIKEGGIIKRKLNQSMFNQLKDYDLIIIDTWALASGLDENDNTNISKGMRALKGWLSTNKSALMIVHHTSKAGMSADNETGTSQIRGASALTDNARLVTLIYPKIIKSHKEKKFSKTEVIAEIVKANYTMKDEQEFTRGEGGKLSISNLHCYNPVVNGGLRPF